MENSPKKKISVNPLEGDALARYTVTKKPIDAFRQKLYFSALPTFIKSAVKLTVWHFILKYLEIGLLKLSEIGGNLHRILEFPVYHWVFVLLFWLYLVWLLIKTAIPVIEARTKATTVAAAADVEDYAFFTDGLIYSNGKDIVRIPWKKVTLITVSFMGMIIRAGSVADTMVIPNRYFCSEFDALKSVLKSKLKIKFICFRKKGRDRAPMYENPLEKIAVAAPEGDVIGELKVSLRLADIADVNRLWLRQIEQKHNRGVFGMILLFICAVAITVTSLLLQEPLLLPAGVILIALMMIYAVYLAIGGLARGKSLLVNRRGYKKPVQYIFYPAGFLMVYENGISYVKYEDLELIFEDKEGLGFFFSKKQCLFIPERYMMSTDGVRLSHFFKASLFNLDAERARRKYRINLENFSSILPKKQEAKPEESSPRQGDKAMAEKDADGGGFGF